MGFWSLSDNRKEEEKEDNEGGRGTESFAGGEQSGIAIQNPGAVVVTIYSNGFTINDGPFRDIEVIANKRFIEDVRNGKAPDELRSYAIPGQQQVAISVKDKSNQTYPGSSQKPKPALATFAGQGHSLASTAARPSQDQSIPVDPSRGQVPIRPDVPTTTLAFRFHDGSRATQTFNITATLAQVHDYVMAVAPVTVPYTLLTGVPPRPIPENPSATLEACGLLNDSLTQRLQ